MPEAACLHIHDRDSGPVRVVELFGNAVRIGRGPLCDVRLDLDTVEAESCRLARRGNAWRLEPRGGRDLVEFEGRTIKGPCVLPYDAAFRIGDYSLTLRRHEPDVSDWELYTATEPSEPIRPALGPDFPAPSIDADWRQAPRERAPMPGPPVSPPALAGPRPPAPPPRANRAAEIWTARWKAAEMRLSVAARASTPEAHESGARAPAPGPRRSAAPEPPLPSHAPNDPPPATVREPLTAMPLRDPPGTVRARPAVPPAGPVERERERERERAFWASPPAPSPPVWSPIAPQPIARPAPRCEFPTAPLPGAKVEQASAPSPVPTPEPTPDPRPEARQSGPEFGPAPALDERPSRDASGPEHEPVIERPSAAEFFDGPELEGLAERPSTPEVVDGPDPNEIDISLRDCPEAACSRPDFDDRIPDEPPVPPAARATEQNGAVPLSGATSGRFLEAPPASLSDEAPATSAAARPRRHLEPARDRERIDDRGERRARPVSSDLPTVKDILSCHRSSPGPKPAVLRKSSRPGPLPTVPHEPASWALPLWLAWPAATAALLVLGPGALALTWRWSIDTSNAAVVAARLASPPALGQYRPLPETIVPPDGRWWTTTSRHMAQWAVHEHEAARHGAGSSTEARERIAGALAIAPLDPMARLVRALFAAEDGQGVDPARDLGQAHDTAALAFSARRLLDAGQKAPALGLYRRALIAATQNGPPPTAPSFRFQPDAEDPAAGRYLLPGEGAARDVLAELVAREDWPFEEWSSALPDGPIVQLAAARLLQERGRAEAAPLLERLAAVERDAMAETGPESSPGDETRTVQFHKGADDKPIEDQVAAGAETGLSSRALAAQAEALALRGRWSSAEHVYRRAIDRERDGAVRRAWWFNLAEIAGRCDDEEQRRAALRAVLEASDSDDVSRRALAAQQGDGSTRARGRARLRVPSARAN